MEEPITLAETFLRYASVRVVVPEDPAEFEKLLRDAWEAGRAKWPKLEVSAHDFVRHLAERLDKEDEEGMPLAKVLSRRKLGDLYLACAWALKVPGADKELENYCLGQPPELSKHFGSSEVDLNDVWQCVLMQVLIGNPEAGSSTRGAQLAEYRGLGWLRKWLLAIAVRMVMKKGGAKREIAQENILELLERASTPGLDPELDFVKRRYRSEFQQALYEAFAALPSDQKSLLQFYFQDRMSTTRLGKLFGVNQSTISRWLQEARDTVFEETKRLLQERFDMSSQEFKSLVKVIKSQLDLSFSKIWDEQGKNGEDEEDEEG